MKLLYFLLRESKSLFPTAVIAGLIGGAASAGIIVVINGAISGGGEAMLQRVLSFVALGLVVLSFSYLSRIFLIRLTQGAMLRLRLDLSRRILATPLRVLEQTGAPRLTAVLADDVPVIALALMDIPLICINLTIILACFVYLGWLSITVLLAVIAFMAPGVFIYQTIANRAKNALKVAREETDKLFKHFRALIEGNKELKLYSNRCEEFFSNSLESAALSLQKNTSTGLSFYAAAESWSRGLFYLFIGLVLFLLPTLVNVNQQAIIGYTITVFYLMSPLWMILATLPNLGKASVALKKIESFGLLLDADEGVEPASTACLNDVSSWKRLEMIGVTHAYHREAQDQSFTLGPISLKVEPGETIFLIGGNGSGKTTLAKLITGLYSPETGEIRLDGTAVNRENVSSYRQLFSVVFSDFFLFDNLLGLHLSQLDSQARDYLVKLQLNHKVRVDNGVLSSIDLSQGQRKRLALLTAYLEDRPIYLFDEWAADQDPMFKDVFYNRLLPELKARGKTVLVITHDDRYFHTADRVIKLEYGEIEYDLPVRDFIENLSSKKEAHAI
jgi:putative ATP-binding cassette transporter